MNNHRGITLMSIAAKVLNRLLLNRIRPIIEPFLRKNQVWFRQGRSTIDQINALRRIFEGAKLKQLPLIALFVDFRKTFDCINRVVMFEILRLYGIPESLVQIRRKQA